MATIDYKILGLASHSFDVEANSTYIYIGCAKSDETTPRILSMSTTLDSDAVITYNPGTGTEVNIKAGFQQGDFLWAVGDFGTDKALRYIGEEAYYWYGDTESQNWYGPIRPIRIDPNDDGIMLTSDYYDPDYAGITYEAYFIGLNTAAYWLPGGQTNGAAYFFDLMSLDVTQLVAGIGTEGWAAAYWYPVTYSPNRGVTFTNISVDDIPWDEAAVACTGVIVG